VKIRRMKTPGDGRAWMEQAADTVLASGRPAHIRGMLFVPDVTLIEGAANGMPPAPKTIQLTRHDGRTVSIFRGST
jgi:hypothetical protein